MVLENDCEVREVIYEVAMGLAHSIFTTCRYSLNSIAGWIWSRVIWSRRALHHRGLEFLFPVFLLLGCCVNLSDLFFTAGWGLEKVMETWVQHLFYAGESK